MTRSTTSRSTASVTSTTTFTDAQRDVLARLKAIRDEVADVLIEREEEIDALLLGLLSRQHVLYVGAPGTAKSATVTEVFRHIDARKYSQQITKDTPREVLIGAQKISVLRDRDEHEYNLKGGIADCDLAFLDEALKGSGAIQSSLLRILNERIFVNNNVEVKVPLHMAALTSNEIPDLHDETDQTGAAFYNRIVLRVPTRPLSLAGERALLDLKARRRQESRAATLTTVTIDEIRDLAEAVGTMAVSDAVLDSLHKLIKDVKAQNVNISNRTMGHTVGIVCAAAALDQMETPGEEHFAALRFVLWNLPAQVEKVRAIVATASNSSTTRLSELCDLAANVYDETRRMLSEPEPKDAKGQVMNLNDQVRMLMENCNKIQVVVEQLTEMKLKAERNNRPTADISKAGAQVHAYAEEIMKAQADRFDVSTNSINL